MRSFPETVRSLTPTRMDTKRATTRPNASTGSPLCDRNLGNGYTTSWNCCVPPATQVHDIEGE